jgi:polyphosphate kinase
VTGLSENIHVRSIVDRFLEHSRIFYFENGCQPEVFIGSADWMPRNFFRRIEVVFPIEDGVLRERIRAEVLAMPMSDNVKANILQPDGAYRRPELTANDKPCRSQMEFIQLALANAGDASKTDLVKSKHPRMKVRTKPGP